MSKQDVELLELLTPSLRRHGGKNSVESVMTGSMSVSNVMLSMQAPSLKIEKCSYAYYENELT